LTHRESVGAGAHVLPAESGQQLIHVAKSRKSQSNFIFANIFAEMRKQNYHPTLAMVSRVIRTQFQFRTERSLCKMHCVRHDGQSTHLTILKQYILYVCGGGEEVCMVFISFVIAPLFFQFLKNQFLSALV
jgi:hypothetical protein